MPSLTKEISFEFKTIAATDINSFNKLVGEHFADGWKTFAGGDIHVTPHHDSKGYGMQYTIALLKEITEE